MALNANHAQQPHFALFPYLAPGHMLPMVDIARLLAGRGVTVTILLTPLNSQRMKPLIDRAIAAGLSIHISIIKFPATQVGLPDGMENFDMLPSRTDAIKLFQATALMKDEVKIVLKELNPSSVISDMCFPWMPSVAHDLGIPMLVFRETSCFAQVMQKTLENSQLVRSFASDLEYFTVPDLPDKIETTIAQLRGFSTQDPTGWEKLHEGMREAEKTTYGTVFNTFEELEPKYVKYYTEVLGKSIWCLGPVWLCNEDEQDKAQRGHKASIDGQQCLTWLDQQKPGSVIYVALGSMSRIAPRQLIELGIALEASQRAFIWVVRNASDEVKAWLSEESFEERIKGRGLLIQGWAPQVMILSHPSLGGFLTHCGWNSTMEGITAGLPMVTWPTTGDQFSNERLVVNVIRTGVRVGVEIPRLFGDEEKIAVQVRSGEIRAAIDKVMDGGDEGEGRRERARRLGEMAKTAMADGGSSFANLTRLIRDVQNMTLKT